MGVFTHCYILYVWGEVGHLFFLAFLAEYSYYFFIIIMMQWYIFETTSGKNCEQYTRK